MYKYKKLQTLINYIITKHRNTSQGANKIIVSPRNTRIETRSWYYKVEDSSSYCILNR